MKNNIVFLTGINSGFGKSLCDVFVTKKFKVIGLSKSIKIKNKNLHVLKTNFEYLNTIEKKLSTIFKVNKNIKYVILNAGSLGEIKKTNELKIKGIKKNLDINLFSNKIIIDFLIKNKIKFKSLIAISSGVSLNTKFGWYSYSLSKVALRFLIENYAIENKKMHFINCSPGLIETSMQKKIRKIDHKIIPSIKTFKEAHLNNKIQKPAEAAIKFYNNIPIMLKSSSGTYLDLRKIN